MLRELFIKFQNAAVIGLGLSFGLFVGYLFAVSVGTLNTFSSGSTVSSSQINSNFTTLKTAIEQNMVPTGTVLSYAGSSAPIGFLLCDGSAVSRTTYADLFAVLGTTWRAGDGTTTFNIPDGRAASPTGAGTSTGYTQNETLSLGFKVNDQFQGHRHDMPYNVGLSSNFFSNSGVPPVWQYFQAAGGYTKTVTDPLTDGTNGTPRTGNVTKGKQFVINFIIKY
ncbi:MAG: phage tail protein [Spirochaetota bacterium]